MGDLAARVVDRLRNDRRLGPQLVEACYLPPVSERFGSLEPPLPPPLKAALARRGVDRLWTHQAEALTAVRRGEDVLVTTPTASGKSLVYQLPVLEEALAGGAGRALFLFPLKALGQDQKAGFDALAAAAGLGDERTTCQIYDGDTPRRARERIRAEPPRVLISNPDMLHLGLLAHWTRWTPFLRDLSWIVLDELHTYRGIFGSHFHHVMQRLWRLCRAEGATPRVVASSATAANAGEFAAALVGRPFRWIRTSGAPREGRHFLFLQPESSPYTTALALFVTLLEEGLKVILFTKARRITELLYTWLRQQAPERARRVANYRSGFLAEERRRIEAALHAGRLDGVISTSALEMGIDVGGLDACILVGYPGSVMATWQRSGRVGRSGRDSITALVALPDALDQYLLRHPQAILDRPCEPLVVDPLNEPVGRAHLPCAAAEYPLSRRLDRDYLAPRATLVDELLRSRDLLEAEDGSELFARRRRPHRDVGLRGSGASYAITDGGGERVVGTVEGVRALHECHPGAIYLHGGSQYLVRALDPAAGRVEVEATRVDYFTVPLTAKETEILEVLDERTDGELLRAWLARLEVTEQVVGFERRRIRGRELLDRRELELDPVRFETVGLFWAAPAAVEASLAAHGEHLLGSLHAAEHATIALLPLLALCDRGDIGGISMPSHPRLGSGCVFVYDGHPGGVGIARQGFRVLPELLAKVLELLSACACEDGCPGCIQSPKCGNGNRPLDKAGAQRLLRLLLGREAPAVAAGEGAGPPVLAPAPEPVAEVASVTPAGSAPPPRPTRPASAERRRAAGDTGRDTVLFDLETLRSAEEVGGWSEAHRMGVAVAVLLHLEEGRFEVFDEGGVAALGERLEAADRVVGFNVLRFDYRVLQGYTGVDYGRRVPTLDLLEDFRRRTGFRVALDHLARETLGVRKTADGLQSLAWVREGRLDLVEAYCRRDVEILRDLYLHGWRMGYVCYRDRADRRVKLPVEW